MKTILEVLGESSARAIIFASITAGVLWGMRVKSPRICHRAWTGVLMAMLCLPLFSIWAPRIAIRVLPAPSIAAAQKPSLPQERMQAVTPELGVTGSSNAAGLPTQSTQPRGTHRPARKMNIYQLAGILYLTGFCVLVFRLLAGTLLSRRLTRGASGDGRILYSPQCTIPMTVGLFCVRVFLPIEAKNWDPGKLDAVLTHEKEHMRRRDPLVEWIALLNRSLYWFNPLAWWLCRKISALAEQACDEAVLVRGHDSGLYAGHLLEFARSVKQRGLLVAGWGSSLHGSTLAHRIRRIMDLGISPAISPARLVCVTSFLVAAVLVPIFFELSPVHAAPPAASTMASASGFGMPAEMSAPEKGPTQATNGQATPDSELQRTLNQMDAVGTTLRTFTARLSQKRYTKIPNEFAAPETGELYLARAQDRSTLLRIDIANPEESTLTIKDGTAVYYQPTIKTAQIIDLGNNKNIAEYMAVGICQSPSSMQKEFEITYQGSEAVNGTACSVLVLKPKSQKTAVLFASVTLWISKSTGLAVQDKLQAPNGDYTMMTLYEGKLNPQISFPLFTQKLPSGVSIQR